MYHHQHSFPVIVAAAFLALPLIPVSPAAAQSLPPGCSTANPGEACVFTNVDDFGGAFEHISFEPSDERAAASIRAKFENLDSFSIGGGNAAIRHTSQHATNFSGEGTEGGPVSGVYRVDWGYFGSSAVSLGFVEAVESVGAFFGGDAGDVCGVDGLVVTLEDGVQWKATRISAGLAAVPNGADECNAINGFLGIDSNGGPKVTAAVFRDCRDAASLDDIFFGQAAGGANGPGPSPTAENPFTSCPVPPPDLPGPGTTELIIPSGIPALVGLPVEVPVELETGGQSIAAVAFSIDYEEACLAFDPTDSDADGVPDALAVEVSADFAVNVFFDAGDLDGEIDVSIVADTLPFALLPDGPVAIVTFDLLCFPSSTDNLVIPVGFSDDPPASFSDPQAEAISGVTVDGSVEVQAGLRGERHVMHKPPALRLRVRRPRPLWGALGRSPVEPPLLDPGDRRRPADRHSRFCTRRVCHQ